MATITIKYGNDEYKLPIAYAPYVMDNITLTDDEIKRDMEKNMEDDVELSLLSIVVILNKINWVKKLLELKHSLSLININHFPLYHALKNVDNKISFDILKLLISKYDTEICWTLINIFFNKKNNSKEWRYMVDYICDNESFYQKNLKQFKNFQSIVNSYEHLDNLENDPLVSFSISYLIFKYAKYFGKRKDYMMFLHPQIKKLFDKIGENKSSNIFDESDSDSEDESKDESEDKLKENEIEENKKLKEENDKLKKEIEQLKKINYDIQIKYNDLENKYNSLHRKCQNLL